MAVATGAHAHAHYTTHTKAHTLHRPHTMNDRINRWKWKEKSVKSTEKLLLADCYLECNCKHSQSATCLPFPLVVWRVLSARWGGCSLLPLPLPSSKCLLSLCSCSSRRLARHASAPPSFWQRLVPSFAWPPWVWLTWLSRHPSSSWLQPSWLLLSFWLLVLLA